MKAGSRFCIPTSRNLAWMRGITRCAPANLTKSNTASTTDAPAAIAGISAALCPSAMRDGRIERWFGTCTDIHEHKEALRTLEKQTRALREAHRRKDDFLAMLAHELRNPLASVVSAVELLRADEAEERAWATEVIARQAGQLTRLIDDLLDVARVNRGKIRLNKEPLDLATVLDRAVETTRPAISDQRHDLATDYPHGELFLEGDPVRLEQIVVNLLTQRGEIHPAGRTPFAPRRATRWPIVRRRRG